MKELISPKNGDDSKFMHRMTRILAILVGVFIIVIVMNIGFNKMLADNMYKTYINNTKEIILSKDSIEASNSWERLPINERKELLRRKFYEIIKFYTNDVTQNQKMSDAQTITSFNAYYNCINAVSSVNFFLPLAYMKVKTNFNPIFVQEDARYGIVPFYNKEGANIASLSLVRENANFQVAFKGKETLQNPVESFKLLIAKMDDLMKTFNNREDWVILALLTNEYDVIAKYWQDGKGEIPEKLYTTGDMRSILNYYYAFKNLQIIPKSITPAPVIK